jgi:hypothetical protein
MTNHPENDGSHIYTAYSEDVIKAAERALRRSKYKVWLSYLGKGALCLAAYYGASPEMYAELNKNSKQS